MIAAVRRHVRIIVHFWRASLMQAMSYRLSFALGVFANACDFCFGLLQYGLFFTAANRLGGWDINTMLAFYAIFMTLFSLHFILLTPNLEGMGRLVNRGELDLVLVRPVSAQALLSFRRISFDDVGSVGTALVLLSGLWLTGRIVVTPERVLAFLVAIGCSTALVYSLFLGLLALAIRLEKFENVGQLTWSFFTLARYPADIFPRWLRGIFYAIVPIAFVTTVPARALTMGERPEVIGLGVVLTLFFLAAARGFWRSALARYASAGG